MRATTEQLSSTTLLNIEALKRFDQDPRTLELRAGVLIARAAAVHHRQAVDAYAAPVLERFSFKDDHGKPITNVRDLWRAEDSPYTDAMLPQFYEACDEARNAAGFVDLPKGHCPALTAEMRVAKRERALLEHASELLGVDFAGTWGDLRTRALDLLEAPQTAYGREALRRATATTA